MWSAFAHKRGGDCTGCFCLSYAKSAGCPGRGTVARVGRGYRAKYLNETAKKVASGYDFAPLYHLNYLAARKELCAFSGVGPKSGRLHFAFCIWQARRVSGGCLDSTHAFGTLRFCAKNDREILSFAAEHFESTAALPSSICSTICARWQGVRNKMKIPRKCLSKRGFHV